MKNKHYILIRLVLNIFLLLAGVQIIISVINKRQVENFRADQDEDCMMALQDTVEWMEENRDIAAELTEIYHKRNRQSVATIKNLLESDSMADLQTASDEERAAQLEKIRSAIDVNYLFMTDASGNIIMSTDTDYEGINLVEAGMITQEQQDYLIKLADNDDCEESSGAKEETLTKIHGESSGAVDETLTEVLAPAGRAEDASDGQSVSGTTDTESAVPETEQPDAEADATEESAEPDYVLAQNAYENCYLYSSVLHTAYGNYYLILGEESSQLENELATLDDLTLLMDEVTIGDDGFIFAINSTDESFYSYKNQGQVLDGEKIADWGIDSSILQEGKSQQKIDGTDYDCYAMALDEETLIVAAVESGEVERKNNNALFWSIAVFLMVTVATLLYSLFLRNDFYTNAAEGQDLKFKKLADKGKHTVFLQKSILAKVAPLVAAGVIIIFTVSFYTQTLLALTKAMEDSERALSDIQKQLSTNTVIHDMLEEQYNQEYLSKLQLISCVLQENPQALNEENSYIHTTYNEAGDKEQLLDGEGNPLRSVANSEFLTSLCQENEIKDIYILDDMGNTIATNNDYWYFTLSKDPEDSFYSFRDVLDDHVSYLIQDETTDASGASSQYLGATFHYYSYLDEEGNTLYASQRQYEAYQAGKWEGQPITDHSSIVIINIDTAEKDEILGTSDVEYILDDPYIVKDGFLLVFDTTEDHKLLYGRDESYIGKTAAELGISDKAFLQDYKNFITVNGTTYFMCFHYEEGYYVATANPTTQIYRYRLKISLYIAICSLIFLLLLMMITSITTQNEIDFYRTMLDSAKEGRKERTFFSILLPSGRLATAGTAYSRWDGRRIPWNEKTPTQKLFIVIEMFLSFVLLYIGLSIVLPDSILTQTRAEAYIISGNWDKGLNVFAIAACFILLVFIKLGYGLIRIVIRIFTSILGVKSETVGHLLISLLRYGSVLGGLFYCAYLLGGDTSSILASASILSLVIGLGAQSLIKDIIAGMFIVFEGEFQVGDIVTVGDFRGQVMDIGLRTTKIANPGQNIKIFNNSDISGVINMTRETSVAACEFGIDYGESLERVEKILEGEFPGIRERNPQILDGPTYIGVVGLNDSSVNLKIVCNCKEADVPMMERVLNREIYLIMNKYQVNIPFPQVTLSYRHDDEDPEEPGIDAR